MRKQPRLQPEVYRFDISSPTGYRRTGVLQKDHGEEGTSSANLLRRNTPMKKISVNGKDLSLEGVDPTTPLLWVLRDHLGLTGTRYGCGKMQCGACTVHVDGKSQRSCMLPVSAVEGSKITSIEGLSVDGDHPLQKAWRDHNVPQCGYCQSGQLMTAAHLLTENSKPSDEDIDKAMDGNICRCGTYPRIRAAVKTAAAKIQEA